MADISSISMIWWIGDQFGGTNPTGCVICICKFVVRLVTFAWVISQLNGIPFCDCLVYLPGLRLGIISQSVHILGYVLIDVLEQNYDPLYEKTRRRIQMLDSAASLGQPLDHKVITTRTLFLCPFGTYMMCVRYHGMNCWDRKIHNVRHNFPCSSLCILAM